MFMSFHLLKQNSKYKTTGRFIGYARRFGAQQKGDTNPIGPPPQFDPRSLI